MTKKVVKIGTRESALAMWQTEFVVEALKQKTNEYIFEIIPIKTKGDKILDVALAKVGDKGLFTKELELAMLAGEIDLAVHSMKDIPTTLVEGLTIAAILQRHDPHDVLVAQGYDSFAALPQGAKVGTSSLRRRSQLLNARPDLDIHDIRGNLNTRMRKMVDEQFDALILAAAGVERLGWSDKITEKLSYELCLPAVSQGAIGIECRADDNEILVLTALIHHEETAHCIKAERALLAALEGGCQIPIGALAEVEGQQIRLRAIVGSLDGQTVLKDQIIGGIHEAAELGETLAKRFMANGAKEILENIRQELDQ